jgi:transcriptional regulator with XRE-family HTH domain
MIKAYKIETDESHNGGYMGAIQIGTIISTKRKEKGLTQEELANHIGVSKPAVSKWESGQSYPDILLLPVLASFFNISIDELIGYEPQMSKEDVRKLYQRLSVAFAKEPFEKVYSECEEYLRKYFSCWELQLRIGLLYLNHINLAGDPNRINEIIERILEIMVRVEKNSEDVTFAKQAVQLEALCYLSLQKPNEAIEILENLNKPFVQSESLLVKAYQMKGDNNKAIEYLQGFTYAHILSILTSSTDFFVMYADKPDKMEYYYRLFVKLVEVFEIEQLYPPILFNIYIIAAQTFAQQGKVDSALEALEQYMEIAIKSSKTTFRLHGNEMFDALEGYFATIEAEIEAPRNAEVIWKDIKNLILHNPALELLEKEERFQRIKNNLSTIVPLI